MIDVRGRNGFFRLAQVDILPDLGDESAGIYLYSAKSCKSSPSAFCGSREELTALFERIVKALREAQNAETFSLPLEVSHES